MQLLEKIGEKIRAKVFEISSKCLGFCVEDVELRNMTFKYGINTSSKYWPADPARLSKRLRSTKTNLESVGISFDIIKKMLGAYIDFTRSS